jgi:hypothetical protein
LDSGLVPPKERNMGHGWAVQKDRPREIHLGSQLEMLLGFPLQFADWLAGVGDLLGFAVLDFAEGFFVGD